MGGEESFFCELVFKYYCCSVVNCFQKVNVFPLPLFCFYKSVTVTNKYIMININNK